MKNISNIIIGVTVSLLVTTNFSCKKSSFVDEKLRSDYSLENMFTSKSLITEGMIGAYSQLKVMYADQLIHYTNLGTDEVSQTGTNTTDVAANQHSYTTSDASLRAVWNAAFKGINMCNTIMGRIDASPVNDPAFKTRIKGESKFLRGLYYFTLARMWGNLPLQLAETTSYQFDYPRVPMADIYQQVFADLQDASVDGVLPAIVTGAEAGRASQGAAKAFLAKAYLYAASMKYAASKGRLAGTYYAVDENGKAFDPDNKLNMDDLYTKAYTAANDVIIHASTYGMSLLPFYGDNFKISNDNNAESIIEVQLKTQSGFGGGWGKTRMGLTANTADYGANAANIQFINALIGVNVSMRPSTSLYDGTGLNKNDVRGLYYSVGDSRRAWNIATYVVGLNTAGVFYEKASTTRTQWGIAKYRMGTLQDPFPSGQVPDQNGNNYALMRFAELYLIRAEALNHSASRNTDAILADLNVLRDRARGDFFNQDNVNYLKETFVPKAQSATPTFIDYTTSAVAALKTADPNGYDDVTFYDLLILRERGLELCFENQRYFDIRRLGFAQDYHNFPNTINTNTTTSGFKTNKNYVFPIPDAEIAVHTNKDNFKQNPNY